jgi:hypothetical protein
MNSLTERIAWWRAQWAPMTSLALVPMTDAMISEKGWTSCYGVGGVGSIPVRMRWLRAECAESLPPGLTMSDIYRSPISSLAAVKAKRGALPPGYSNHNYGGAVDVDVDMTMRRMGMKSKAALDEYMTGFGWHCHRSDHRRGSEDWHYNHLPDRPAGAYSSDEAEARLVALYGAAWAALKADVRAEQTALKAAGMYEGIVDGDAGPMTKSGREVFKRTWLTKPTANYHRVLWLVAESRRY